MAKRSNRSRRDFLRMAGTAGAAGAIGSLFPWLRAAGQGTPRDPKLAVLFFPHGTVWDQWRPSAADPTSSHILSPLAGFRDRLAVLDGLNVPDNYSHRVPHTYDSVIALTGSPIDTSVSLFERMDHGVSFGWNTGKSIDQEIADRLDVSTRFRTIELGVAPGGSHPGTRLVYRGPAMWRDPINTPSRAWDQIFGGLGTSDAERNDRRRRSVLDAVVNDIRSLQPHLSSSDRVKLDAHAESLREIERGLGGVLTCTPPDRPTDRGLQYDIDAQLDLAANALACGQTRISTIQIGRAENDGSLYPWTGIGTGGHHLTTHSQASGDQQLLADLYRWYMERVNGFLTKLDSIPDGDGYTLLDNTMVVVISELGIGWNHNADNVPFLVAGGGAGRLNPGYFDLRGQGYQHNRLLVSMANVMGVNDLESWGTWDNSTGPVPGLLTA